MNEVTTSTIWYDLIVKQLPIVAFLSIVLYMMYKYFSKKETSKDLIIQKQYDDLMSIHTKTIASISQFSSVIEKNMEVQERNMELQEKIMASVADTNKELAILRETLHHRK